MRLRYAYIIRCDEVIKNDAGEVIELHCTYDPDTRSGTGTSDRKVKGTIHWVAASDAVAAQVRLYDRLFTDPDPGRADDVMTFLNPNSLETVTAWVEPSLAAAECGFVCQFERLGYFCADAVEHRSGNPVFNRIVTLRDTWAKLASAAKSGHS